MSNHFAALRVKLERHVIGERPRGNDHAGGVDRDVAGVAFQSLGQINNFFGWRVALVKFGQFRRHFQSPGNGHREALRAERNQARDFVADAVRMTESPGDIADGAASEHGAEGADLSDLILAVFLPGVGDNFVAPVVGKVHINIRRARPFGIQKAFKGNLVSQRVNLGDVEGVGDERAGDRAADVVVNIVLAGVTNQVVNDEKVGSVTFHLNHGEFAGEARFRRRLARETTRLQATTRRLFQNFVGGLIGGNREVGENKFAERQFQITPLGNCQSVCHRLGRLGKIGGGGFRRNERKILLAIEKALVLVKTVGVYRHQSVVGFGVFRFQIVGILSGDQRDFQAVGQSHERRPDFRLAFQFGVVHNFHEVIFGTENFLILAGQRFGRRLVLIPKQARKFRTETTGETNQSFVMTAQEFQINSRFVVVTFQIGSSHQFD